MNPTNTENQPNAQGDSQGQVYVGGATPPDANRQELPQAVVNGAPVTASPKKKFLKTKLGLAVVAGAAVVVVFGGSAAAYFGYVVPNQPENVWKTAMDKTAKGMDTLIASEESHKDTKGVKMTGSYKMTGEFATDGTIEAQTYNNNATFKFDIGAVTTRVNVEGRMIMPANSTNPDIYLKASGLKGLGSIAGDYGQLVEGFDNQWIAIDHTLLDNVMNSAGASTSTEGLNVAALTQDDMIKIAKAMNDVNKKYLFTTDQAKSVVTVASKVGKESQDGRSVYHFKVGLNKANTKEYANAMVDALQNSPFTKVLDGKKVRDVIDVTSLTKAIDEIKSSDTADVYVDMGTKLVRSIRFTDPSDTATYVELKVPYTGGDKVPFNFTLVGRSSDSKSAPLMNMSFAYAFDMKAYQVDLDVNLTVPGENGSKDETMSMKLKATPTNDKLDVTKPAGAKSLNELLGAMFGVGNATDLFGATGSASSSSLFDGSTTL